MPKSDMFEIDADESTNDEVVVRGAMQLKVYAATEKTALAQGIHVQKRQRTNKLKQAKCLRNENITKSDMFEIDVNASTDNAASCGR